MPTQTEMEIVSGVSHHVDNSDDVTQNIVNKTDDSARTHIETDSKTTERQGIFGSLNQIPGKLPRTSKISRKKTIKRIPF